MFKRTLAMLSATWLCACASAPSGSGLAPLDMGSEERGLNWLFGLHDDNCERPMALDRELRQYVLESGKTTAVDFPTGAARPIVIASPPNAYGVFLFRYGPSGWQSYFVAAGSLPQALRISPDGKMLYVVSMWSREAPGDYHVATLSGEGGHLSCATLARPPFQRSLDHGAFAALDIDERGRGNLVTKATLERERRTDVQWFRYETRDEGRSWSEAEQRAAPSEPLKDLRAPPARQVEGQVLAEIINAH
jgi:hypothetical protein